MATTKPKKPFKLNVLGLFKWESEEWTVKEVAIILAMVMAFILIMVLLLKLYAVPALGTPMAVSKVGIWLGKITKSRAP